MTVNVGASPSPRAAKPFGGADGTDWPAVPSMTQEDGSSEPCPVIRRVKSDIADAAPFSALTFIEVRARPWVGVPDRTPVERLNVRPATVCTG